MTRYATLCCTGDALAFFDVRRPQSGSLTVKVEDAAPRGHLQIVINPVVDGKPTWPADELSAATHAGTAERNVTEIGWGDHRSWTIRCGNCPEQVEISGRNLPRLAEWLDGETWTEINGMCVLPLGVLSRKMGQPNW